MNLYQEFEEAASALVENGIIFPTGEDSNGRIVYVHKDNMTPELFLKYNEFMNSIKMNQ